ncbi:MAG: alpha/beta hydrolase [Bacteroidota bacterium]
MIPNISIKKVLVRIGLFFLIFIGLILFVPYLIPLSESQAKGVEKPFVNSQFMNIDGMSIHYRVWVPKAEKINAKWVLLVHGLGGSTYSWENNAQRFCDEGFHVVAVDVPPFGYSDRNPDFNQSPDSRANLLWKFAIVLNADVQWNLIGHSMGGGIVEAMAIIKPEKTKSVVLVDAALFKSMKKEFSYSQFILTFPPFERLFSVVGEHFFITKKQIKKMLLSAFGREPTVKEINAYYNALSIDGTARAFIRAFTKAKVVTEMDFDQFKAPTLAIWGDNDTWVPYDGYKLMLDQQPNIQVKMIKGAHHCPMETHIEEFNKLVLEFLLKNN